MVSFQNISLKFEDRQLFDSFSFDIARGEKAALKGRSGSGKTTLLNMAMGFMKPDSGKIIINGEEVNGSNISILRKQMCWLPQSITGFNMISASGMLKYPFSYNSNKKIIFSQDEIDTSISAVNLEKNVLEHTFDKISGGEKQRLGLILCKLLKREIIILDEPTSALDKESLKMVAEFIMQDPEVTVLSASHDDEWLKYCNRIIEL